MCVRARVSVCAHVRAIMYVFDRPSVYIVEEDSRKEYGCESVFDLLLVFSQNEGMRIWLLIGTVWVV